MVKLEHVIKDHFFVASLFFCVNFLNSFFFQLKIFLRLGSAGVTLIFFPAINISSFAFLQSLSNQGASLFFFRASSFEIPLLDNGFNQILKLIQDVIIWRVKHLTDLLLMFS